MHISGTSWRTPKAIESVQVFIKHSIQGIFLRKILSVCENEEEKRVAALSQDQFEEEIGAKIKAGEIDASVRLGTLWMQIHARVYKKKFA